MFSDALGSEESATVGLNGKADIRTLIEKLQWVGLYAQSGA